MEPQPLVSVIVPCYNGAAFLSQALDSILAQTYRPIEIIVIDDGSTDDSVNIAQSYPDVRYAHQEHAGLGAALNHGIRLAEGDLFGFLDSDDLWVKDKLTKQVGWLLADPLLDMVFGYLTQFNEGETQTRPAEEGYFKGTLLIRRDAFFQVGLFATEYRVGDFVDWFMRAHELGLEYTMPTDVLLKRRIHDNNMGTRERDHRKAFLHIIKKSLERRAQKT